MMIKDTKKLISVELNRQMLLSYRLSGLSKNNKVDFKPTIMPYINFIEQNYL